MTMRFLTLFTPDKPIASASDPEHMKEMNRLVDEQTKAGVLIATGAFLKSAEGARVRRIDGDYTVRDGASPFQTSAGRSFRPPRRKRPSRQ